VTTRREIAMTEGDLRELIAAVEVGRMSRRAFVHRMVGLGLTAPFAGQLLTHAGIGQAATTRWKVAASRKARIALFWTDV